jgi:hypothetical protein
VFRRADGTTGDAPIEYRRRLEVEGAARQHGQCALAAGSIGAPTLKYADLIDD